MAGGLYGDRPAGLERTGKDADGLALAYPDRGQAPGGSLAGLLRPGNPPAGATAELVGLVDLAAAQLPATGADQPVLVRSDSAEGDV